MKTFLLDDEGDLEFDGQNNIKIVKDADEKQQSLKNRLGTGLGEWFLNGLMGLDMFAIFGKYDSDSDNRTRAAVVETLEQESRITSINSIDISFDGANRNLIINFDVVMDGEQISWTREAG